MDTRKTLKIVMAAILMACWAHADRLVLGDGDVLSGQLITLADGVLMFQTSLAGRMLVPTDEVTGLTTGGAVKVTFGESDQRMGRFVADKGKTFLVAADGTREAINLSAIECALPVEPGASPPASTLPDIEPERLEGAWETGVHARAGNEDYTELFGELTLTRTADLYAFRARAMLERADVDDFPRWLLADMEWVMGTGSGMYPVFNVGVERDTDEGLSMRGTVGAGVGHTLIRRANQTLEAQAGIAATAESFDAETLPDEARPALFTSPIDAFLNDAKRDLNLDMRLRLHYHRAVLGQGEVTERIDIHPSLTDWGNVRARSESALVYPLRARLRLKLHLLVDYTDDPAFPGLDQWRTSVGASILWDF